MELITVNNHTDDRRVELVLRAIDLASLGTLLATMPLSCFAYKGAELTASC
jgi:hypothetical protein